MDRKFLFFSVSALILIFAACGGLPAVEHQAVPGVPTYSQYIVDCNTGSLMPMPAPIEPAGGCDAWSANRYERPFNAETQDEFYPELDILQAQLGRSGDWYYFRQALYDVPEDNGELQGSYGMELDLDQDGRGDVLIFANAPAMEEDPDWSVAGVQVWQDSNNEVGDELVMQADPPNQGSGYDLLVFDQGQGFDPDAAWVRAAPGKPMFVEIAFKPAVIGDDAAFKWWAWSDEGVQDPAMFDFHDAFDHPEAGDVYEAMQFFPANEVYAVDNTCAAIWGAPPDEDPSLCVNDPSVPSATPFNDTFITDTPTPPGTPPDGSGTPPGETETPCVSETPGAPALTCTPSGPTETVTLPSSPTEPSPTGCIDPFTGAQCTSTATPRTPTGGSPTPTQPCPVAGAAQVCTPTPSSTPTRPPENDLCQSPTGAPTCTPTTQPE